MHLLPRLRLCTHQHFIPLARVYWMRRQFWSRDYNSWFMHYCYLSIFGKTFSADIVMILNMRKPGGCQQNLQFAPGGIICNVFSASATPPPCVESLLILLTKNVKSQNISFCTFSYLNHIYYWWNCASVAKPSRYVFMRQKFSNIASLLLTSERLMQESSKEPYPAENWSEFFVFVWERSGSSVKEYRRIETTICHLFYRINDHYLVLLKLLIRFEQPCNSFFLMWCESASRV